MHPSMISFDSFVPAEGKPIYQQIILHIKQQAVAGNVHTGDALPSRRMLSALLGVNPNTVQKAFRLLEEEGLVQSHAGAKSVMVLNEQTIQTIRTQLVEEDARSAVSRLKQMGLKKEEVLSLMEQVSDKVCAQFGVRLEPEVKILK